jgi:hypothetical protein
MKANRYFCKTNSLKNKDKAFPLTTKRITIAGTQVRPLEINDDVEEDCTSLSIAGNFPMKIKKLRRPIYLVLP